MGTLLRDLRFGTRMLLKRPVFTLATIGTLAIGIGASIAVFALLDTVLLKRLPVGRPERLVLARWSAGPNINVRSLDGAYSPDPATGLQGSTSFSYPTLERLEVAGSGAVSLFGFSHMMRINASVDGSAEIAAAQVVTGDYHEVLGVAPFLGRVLDARDDSGPGAEPVAVLDHGYWKRRFGGDREILGKTLYLNGSPFTVVGVTQPGFTGALNVGQVPEVSVTVSMIDRVMRRAPGLEDERSWWLQIMGRLDEGATLDAAQARLVVAFRQDQTAGLPADHDFDIPTLRLESGSQGLLEGRRRYSETIAILAGAVGLILVIACVNIAHLLLAHSGARRREFAVRLALGSSAAGLVRQLMTESVLLSLLGGGGGLLLAAWGRHMLLAALPVGHTPLELALPLDLRVLGFSAGLSILVGLAFSLAPVWRGTRVDPGPALKSGTGALSSGSSWLSLGRSFVVAQVALSVVLLTGAGLFARSFSKLHRIDAGFDASNVLLFRLDPTLNRYEGERLLGLYEGVLDELRAHPDVRGASLSMFPLVGGRSWRASVDVEEYTPAPDERTRALIQLVSHDFLGTMRIPILSGRDLEASDVDGAPPVAVIDQAMAERYFPGGSPLGKRFRFGSDDWIEVVGVAGNAKYDSLRSGPTPTFFVPYRQRTRSVGSMFFSVRTSGDPTALLTSVREIVRAADPNLPIFHVRTQEGQILESLVQERQLLQLSSALAAVALVLVSVGLLGLLTYTVSRRTPEIGLRVALGARRASVLRLVLGQGMALVGIGLGVGLLAAFGLTRFLESLLFGVATNDPVTYAGIALVLLGTGALACCAPAMRALRVDPIAALRHE